MRLASLALFLIHKKQPSTGFVGRQNYNHNAKHLLAQQGRCAHARQMKRARGCTRKLKICLGRVIRDIEYKCRQPDEELQSLLDTIIRIFHQHRHDKNKVYSVHEPAVECTSKGKAHKRYEFGYKPSVAATSRGSWIIGVKAIHGTMMATPRKTPSNRPSALRDHRNMCSWIWVTGAMDTPTRSMFMSISADVVEPLKTCGAG